MQGEPRVPEASIWAHTPDRPEKRQRGEAQKLVSDHLKSAGELVPFQCVHRHAGMVHQTGILRKISHRCARLVCTIDGRLRTAL